MVVVALFAIASVSFVSGMMTQNAIATAPLVVEYCGATRVADTREVVANETMRQESVALEEVKESPAIKGCAYVGSRNSTKYYPPTCSFAKRIAPENLRCFTSDEDARNKGYVRSKGC